MADKSMKRVTSFQLLAAIDSLAIEPIAFHLATIDVVRVVVPIVGEVSIAAERVGRRNTRVGNPIRTKKCCGDDRNTGSKRNQRWLRSTPQQNETGERQER